MARTPTADAPTAAAAKRRPQFRVVTCDEWGARRPRKAIAAAGRPKRIIFHHTGGHAPNVDRKPTESLDDAKAYARLLQLDHMNVRGWNDTGHNFLISRSGHILEGRRGSWAAIKRGRMVVSAHCPGQNDQPGIEHEHHGSEGLTRIQKQASIWLHANVCRYTGIRPTSIDPHRRWYATPCPTDELVRWLPTLRLEVAKLLTDPPDREWRDDWLRWWEVGAAANTLGALPDRVWRRLVRYVDRAG